MGIFSAWYGRAPMSDATRPQRWRPFALALAVTAVLAVTLPAGFLGYDDPWLVADNPMLRDPSFAALRAVWTGFDLPTRMVLGAEYLPVRDTFVWAIARGFGVHPFPYRVAQLVTYLGAVLLLRAWLLRVAAPTRRAELAAWLFALHPAHVSSVVWVAGTKDALSLLFLAAALRVYVGASRARTPAVAALTALACLSKGTSVVAPALLLAGDLLARRSIAWRPVAASALVAAGSVALQLTVGRVVGMLAPPLGEGLLGRVASMAPVALRYVGISLLVDPPCIVREVVPRRLGDPVALVSLVVIAAAIAASVAAWRRGRRLPLVALGVFAAGLAPVSQVLVPLQNRMADRYLLVAVLGPCLVVAALVARYVPKRLFPFAAGALVLATSASSALHAAQFADEVWLWTDAAARLPEAALPPYQLAHLYRARGDTLRAERYFREALARDALRTPLSGRAATNLSQILAATGRAPEAVAILRAVAARDGSNPRVLYNLAQLLPPGDEARALLRQVVTRFPDYARGRAAWLRRYGPLPPEAPPPPPTGRWQRDPYAQ